MIKIDNLGFSYGAFPVLKNISMELKGGNIYGLLGENGVGKTTLLTLLCGLKRPGEGSIEVDGRRPFDRVPSLLAEQFFLPETVAPVHARALSFARENGVFRPFFDLDKFATILREFEVDPEQRMDAMSAGQLKKTWISFALACNAKYYYFDEPTNGLDIPSKAQFRKAVTRYTGEDATLAGGDFAEALLRLRLRHSSGRAVSGADAGGLRAGVSQHDRRGEQSQPRGVLQHRTRA